MRTYQTADLPGLILAGGIHLGVQLHAPLNPVPPAIRPRACRPPRRHTSAPRRLLFARAPKTALPVVELWAPSRAQARPRDASVAQRPPQLQRGAGARLQQPL